MDYEREMSIMLQAYAEALAEVVSSHTEEEEVVDGLRVVVDGFIEVVMVCQENENENGDGDIFPIYYEMFSMGEVAKQLLSKLLFHSNCILLWLRRRNSCPMCRDEPAVFTSLNDVD